MARVVVLLEQDERDALCALAEREFRDPRAQAALIIRRELERAGLVRSKRERLRDEPSTESQTRDGEGPAC